MNFEEWLESKGHIDGYRTDYQSAYDEGFDEGVKTQQAKIGILQIKLNGADERAAAVLNHKNKMIDELQAKIEEINEVANGWKDEYRIMSLRYERSKKRIDELQARIDSLTNINESLVAYKNQLLDEIEEKGNKDEN